MPYIQDMIGILKKNKQRLWTYGLETPTIITAIRCKYSIKIIKKQILCRKKSQSMDFRMIGAH